MLLRWRGDVKEIFYVEGDTLMAVSVTTSPAFSPGAARPLFEDRPGFEGRGQQYDVTPDGQRFVVVETLGDADARPFMWSKLVRRVPRPRAGLSPLKQTT